MPLSAIASKQGIANKEPGAQAPLRTASGDSRTMATVRPIMRTTDAAETLNARDHRWSVGR